MLKPLSKEVGYVYYIAVVPALQRKGIGRKLLQDALEHFSRSGATEVYATVGLDNAESNALFYSLGFRRTDFSEISREYGAFRALAMYRGMWVVPGEAVLVRDTETLQGPGTASSG